MQAGEDWYVSIGSDMEHGKALVLCAGVARGKKFSGEEDFLGRGVSYCATCDGMLYRGRPVAVLGYSDTARREAEFLEGIGCSVTYFDKPKACEIDGAEQVSGKEINSLHDYKDIAKNRKDGLHIDHVFYTPANSRAVSAKVVLDNNTKIGSDHLPIYMDWLIAD